MIGSRIPSTIKLSGLYLAIVDAGSSSRLTGKKAVGEEEDHEDQREQALDDARPAALRIAIADPISSAAADP